VTTDVLTLGETMVALRTDSMLRLGGTLRMSIAGAESNVAIGLARLGHQVSYVSRMGDDELGEFALRTLRAEGVGIDEVVVQPGGATGMILFDVGPGGRRRVHYRRSDSAAGNLSPDDMAVALQRGARILHVSGITPALGEGAARATLEAARQVRRDGGTVCLDVNFRSKLWQPAEAAAVLRQLLPHLDILIASVDELCIMADGATEDAQVSELLGAGIREVAVKRGDRGATAHTSETQVSKPALRVPVVDPIGAGDAFCAGYLSGLLDDLPLSDRVARAVALGAAAVASSGDWEGLPTRADLSQIADDSGEVLR
jgi:2-dehydro-3-deoxygluconokinase